MGTASFTFPALGQLGQELGAPLAAQAAEPEKPARRPHRHRHRHRDGDERARPRSAERVDERCASPGLVAIIEDQRPKSFTEGERSRHRHSSNGRHSSPSGRVSPPPSGGGGGGGGGGQRVHQHQHQPACHMGSNGGAARHAAGARQSASGGGAAAAPGGRHSPLRSAREREPHGHRHGAGLAGGHGGLPGLGAGPLTSHGAGADGGSPGRCWPALAPKLVRVMSESVPPEHIAKGFAPQMFSRRALDIFTGSRPAGTPDALARLLPTWAALHLWCVRPPRSRLWVPLHLGAADNLQAGVRAYLHPDGSAGPPGEPGKRRVMHDLLCRGFALQIRFRPAKPCPAALRDDALAKLSAFDLPLNDADNGA
ncbi:hypothetical protein HT031_005058 [Scenedesmus sp. PABB004]|nr:hypothetical protein HT031_005058 [Scenedesmus sp. PABB004]